MSVSAIPPTVFLASSAALVGVGLLSWRRTQGIRQGQVSTRAPPEAILARTSRLTWLAAGAGLGATAWGATIVTTSVAPGLGLLAGGAFVTLAGLLGRVKRVQADGSGLTILFARGKPFYLAWPDLVSVQPPRTPLGGWRFGGRIGARMLMPSDLWGLEELLPLTVAAAGLWFDGTGWSGRTSRR